MTNPSHKQLMDLALRTPLANADSAKVSALGALYHLLEERLPAAPMQVIDTPSAPAQVDNLSRSARYHCVAVPSDYIQVSEAAIGEIEFHIPKNVSAGSIFMTNRDAVRLARSILAHVEGQD